MADAIQLDCETSVDCMTCIFVSDESLSLFLPERRELVLQSLCAALSDDSLLVQVYPCLGFVFILYSVSSSFPCYSSPVFLSSFMLLMFCLWLLATSNGSHHYTLQAT